MIIDTGGVDRVSKTLVDAIQEDPLYLYEKNTPVCMPYLRHSIHQKVIVRNLGCYQVAL